MKAPEQHKFSMLREFTKFSHRDELLTESDRSAMEKTGVLILAGVGQRANAINHNGREYPKHLLMREGDNYQKLIRERRSLGCLDHPDNTIIELQEASHLITELWWKDNEMMVKVEILNTPKGNILRSLYEQRVPWGLSTRGLGSVTEGNGRVMVNDDYNLICFDAVSDPSTHNAFMNQTISESAVRGMITKADRINRLMNDILRRQ